MSEFTMKLLQYRLSNMPVNEREIHCEQELDIDYYVLYAILAKHGYCPRNYKG